MKREPLFTYFVRFKKNKKLLRVMKIAIVLSFVFVFQLFATDSGAQNAIIQLPSTDLTVGELIRQIEKQTDYLVVFSNSEVNTEQTLHVEKTTNNVAGFLEEALADNLLTYEFENNYIILSKKAALIKVPQQTVGKQITGTVIDGHGESVIGANVVEKGTTNGTITGIEGDFSLTVREGATLLVTYVGFVPQEIVVGNRSSLQIHLTEDSQTLNEVIVVGYGVQKAATVTGAVSAVKGEKLMISPTVNYSQTLAGRLPGLIAVSGSGEPGSDDATLRIRGLNTIGDNSPLVVIDGVPGRDMNRLSADDIESMSILKDASAAIYGARAANGVILITTKRGNTGKPQVNISYNEGWSQPTVIPEMADAATYLTMLNEINMYAGGSPRYTEEEIANYRKGDDPWLYPNTDWFGETFKNFASQRKVNGSIRGGNDSFRYFVSIGGNTQDGIYKNSATKYSQANFRGNIDGRINRYIKVGFDIAGRQENRNFPTVSAASIFSMLVRGKPNIHAYWPNGMNGPDIAEGLNPVVITTKQTGYDKRNKYTLETKANIEIQIPGIDGLTLSGNYSYDKYFEYRKTWQTPWYLYSWDGVSYDENNQPVLSEGIRGLSNPELWQRSDNNGRTTLNALLSYEKTFASNHNIKTMVGAERITGDEIRMDAERKYYISTALDELFAGGDLEKTNTGYSKENKRMNFFGRINYDYQAKYLLEFLWRVDGSYIFPSSKRYGFFPGVSAGWRISEEGFWKNALSFIDYFKIRGSWGQTGNDRIDPYQFLSSYAFLTNTEEIYAFNVNTQNKVLQESRIPNPNVTWEVGNQSNVGFDGQLLKGKLTFSFDYFYNYRTHILWNRNASVPGSTGLTLPKENIGKYSNKGVEFQVGYADQVKDFNYSVSVNGGTSKSKIKYWDETPGIPDYQKTTGYPAPLNSEGKIDVNYSLYYKAIGIFRDDAHLNSYPHWAGARPGDVIFEDVNNDGIINGLDRIRINKNLIPTFTGGVNIDLGYKNIYTTIFFQWATGAVRYRYFEMQGEAGNFLKNDAEGRWTPDNPDAKKARTWNRYGEYWRNNRNTYWLEDNDYLRLKNLEIGYIVPRKILDIFGLEALRIYASGQNLFTIDKIKNFDPESENAQSYPTNRIINVGLNITF
jgi:TonB-linked SusC/RagA family outer membrane protein